MKSAGNEYFRNGNEEMASENWGKALLKIRRVKGGAEGKRFENLEEWTLPIISLN